MSARVTKHAGSTHSAHCVGGKVMKMMSRGGWFLFLYINLVHISTHSVCIWGVVSCHDDEGCSPNKNCNKKEGNQNQNVAQRLFLALSLLLSPRAGDHHHHYHHDHHDHHDDHHQHLTTVIVVLRSSVLWSSSLPLFLTEVIDHDPNHY